MLARVGFGLLAGGGIGGFAWHAHQLGMRQLIDQFGRDDPSPAERARWGRDFAQLPLPPDALPNLPPAGSQGAAMPFQTGDHAGLVSPTTHRIHWERHYSVYAGRALRAARALETGDLGIVGSPSAEELASLFWSSWLGLVLHQKHWSDLLCDQEQRLCALSRQRHWEAVAKQWDPLLPSADGILLIYETWDSEGGAGSLSARFSSDFAALLPEPSERPHLALDLFRHAWTFDGDRARWIAAWMAIVEANGRAEADALERIARTAPTVVDAARASAGGSNGERLGAEESASLASLAIDAPPLSDRALRALAANAPAGVERADALVG